MTRHARNVHSTERPTERVGAFSGPSPTPGLCLWCGGKIRGALYCGPKCRQHYDNWITKVAKPIMRRLLLWRRFRGRKGTPGAGQLSDIAAMVDAAAAETKARQAGGHNAGGGDA